MVGPYRGGRVTAVEGFPGAKDSYLMGTVGGEVWKTDDAGEQWTSISDGAFSVASIGAVVAAPSDPQVLYVDTGSACIRGHVSTGRGLYRSTDGGDSWEELGGGLPTGLTGRIGLFVSLDDGGSWRRPWLGSRRSWRSACRPTTGRWRRAGSTR